ncbi:transposase [Planctomycetes bacterium CA13]|uniref:transposase n=1 Tax=Novipirellula herctigrandis TaxID=2527986 RepID=UPI0011B57BD3
MSNNPYEEAAFNGHHNIFHATSASLYRCDVRANRRVISATRRRMDLRSQAYDSRRTASYPVHQTPPCLSSSLRQRELVHRHSRTGGLRPRREAYDQATYDLVGDDTLIHKTGLKVYGAGMHRDACQSSSGFTSFRCGHCWVVLCVLVPSRKDPNRKFAIPILMRLYLNTKTNEKLRRKHRKKTDLMLAMIRILANHAADKSLHFIADSAYTGGRILQQIPAWRAPQNLIHKLYERIGRVE